MSNTKEKIINAAIDQFAANGYTETSVRSISQQAGIRSPSMYSHFPSKSSILEHILNINLEVTVRDTISLEEVDKLMETEDARTILRKMFYLYRPEEAERNFKILKIILHEQYREKKAQEFMKVYMFQEVFAYIKTVLDKLMACGKIRPVNTSVYAKLFLSLTVSTSAESVFYSFDEYQKLDSTRAADQTRRFDINEFLIDQLMPDSPPEQRRIL